MTEVRTRFSPSPTGMIHLGNARAALFSALFASKNNGHFILRIEDTDAVRSEDKYVDSLKSDLHWLGVYWQEGPDVGGNYGPYWQSQRQDIYNRYYEELEVKKLIYPCFCTDQELNLARKLQLSRGHAPRYSGTCLKLSEHDIQKKLSEGKKPAWRFKVPKDAVIEYEDAVKGPQKFESNDIGDFIVRRADGTAPFLYCNAIDDAMMKVSHALRGEDHVANTPRQILILRALELTAPQYGHLSLIVGDDGAPLSKRHGSYSLNQLHEQGFLPIAIMNYLARLGHTCDAHELLPFELLSQHFYLDKLSRSPARFDASQLMYWQKTAIQSMDDATIWSWLGEDMLSQVPENKRQLFVHTVRANIEFPYDALEWAKIFFHELVHLDAEESSIVRASGEQFFVAAEQAVDSYGIDVNKITAEMKSTLGVSGKKLFMPLRIALTGRMHGPELIHVAELLGKDKMKHRFGAAFKLASINQ